MEAGAEALLTARIGKAERADGLVDVCLVRRQVYDHQGQAVGAEAVADDARQGRPTVVDVSVLKKKLQVMKFQPTKNRLKDKLDYTFKES
jgi:hypothetical protein